MTARGLEETSVMSTDKPRCTRRQLIAAACAMLLILVALLLFLCLADSQISRWVYVFQSTVYPAKDPDVPREFTGVFKRWASDGRLLVTESYRNGELHGEYVEYGLSGTKRVCVFSNGQPWEGQLLNFSIEHDRMMLFTYESGEAISISPP